MFSQVSVCPRGAGAVHPWTDLPDPRHIPPSPIKMATAADGTHPTGMHSCNFYAKIINQLAGECCLKFHVFYSDKEITN